MTKNLSHACKNRTLRVALLAALGSGMEYYDFVIYGMMAKYLSIAFFSSADATAGLIQVFTLFAVGYIARPLGGVIIGMLADTYGRKKAFLITTFTMAFATVGIGLLPTYRQIGLFASVLLMACRILQGLSFGAELPGATTIVSEFSAKSTLGKYCGVILSSTSIGSFVAVIMLAGLSEFFNFDQIIENQIWRIPFLIGGVLAIVSYYIRQHITETPEFTAYTRIKAIEKAGMVIELKRNLKTLMIGFGLMFYLSTLIIINIYLPAFISEYFKYSLSQIYKALSISMLLSFVFMLMFGFISDFISKTKMMLFTLGISLCLMPFTYTLLGQNNFVALMLFFVINQMLISMYFTSCLPILSRLFPTQIRYTATALTYNLAFSIASAIPAICVYLYSKNNVPYFLGGFFVFATGIAFIAALLTLFKGQGQHAY